MAVNADAFLGLDRIHLFPMADISQSASCRAMCPSQYPIHRLLRWYIENTKEYDDNELQASEILLPDKCELV
jgi:hypothetical protein